jgi:tetratricopeptide (TPR) repeat protein
MVATYLLMETHDRRSEAGMGSEYLSSRWTPRLCALLLFWFSLGFAGSALADSTRDARPRAMELFKQSAEHYEAGRYAVAAALLEEAYALHPEPKLLYNLGRAREANAETKLAAEAYEAYLLADPSTDRVADVQRRIDQLRAQLSQQPAPAETPVPVHGAGETQAPATAPAEPEESAAAGVRRRRIVPWVLVGAGGAVLGTALAVGLMARAQQRDAETEPSQAEALELQRAAESKALTANLLAGAGGALVLAGGAWLLFGGRHDSGSRARGPSGRAWLMHVGPAGFDCTFKY